MRIKKLPICSAVLLAVGVMSSAYAQNYSPVTAARLTNPEPENWLMTRGNYQGWSYSPLDKINTGNVKKLVPIWSYSTGVTSGHQSPPIVNNGVMFVSTPSAQVLALNAKTDHFHTALRRHGLDIGLTATPITPVIVGDSDRTFEAADRCMRHGVYLTASTVNGETYRSVTNIGVRPTFGANRPSVETHLLDFDSTIYDETLQLEFWGRLRDEKKFDSVDALKRQITLDVNEARGKK